MILFMPPYHKLTKTTTIKTTIITTYNNSSIRSDIMNKISYNENITKKLKDNADYVKNMMNT